MDRRGDVGGGRIRRLDRVYHRRRCNPVCYVIYGGGIGSGTGPPGEVGGPAASLPPGLNPELGVVLRPVGVLSVTWVAPNSLEGTVQEVYAFVRPGDLVRPAPVHDLRPGDTPARVTSRITAAVIEFGELHQLYGLRAVTILDKDSRDGVDIGDEYVAFSGDGSTEEVIERLSVVLTEEETSSSEIVTLGGPVFHVGTTVYLDRKMR